jgi:hypothetical protein
MTSPFERRLSKVEAATRSGEEARIYQVATPELAHAMWAAAVKEGRSAGMFFVNPGQVPPVITGPTIDEMLRDINAAGKRIHDKDPNAKKLAPWKEGDPYLWREPKPGDLAHTH